VSRYEQVRRRVRERGRVVVEDILEVEAASEAKPSVEGLVLLGVLIQMNDSEVGPELDAARVAFERAAELDPCDPEPLVELGHYYDAILDEPELAKAFFERAIACGGDSEAAAGLAAVLKQLRGT
jgi:hypothetical protein